MSEINVEDLLNTSQTGVFDKLLGNLQQILKTEHAAGRITGIEYSKSFTAIADAVLSQSMQFLLQKDLAAKQADVAQAQRLLIEEQTKAVTEDIKLTQANTAKIVRETALLNKQESLMDSQIALTDAQISKLLVEEQLLEIEKTKLVATVSLIQAQTAEVDKQILILAEKLLQMPKESLLLDKQAVKLTAETDFLAQRMITETAQTQDLVEGVAVTGVIGRQRALYQAQTDGLIFEGKYKTTNMLVGTWTVRKGVDDTGVDADNVNNLRDATIGSAITNLMTTAGIPLAP